MASVEESTLIELLNIIIKDSSINISNIKELSDESKLVNIINTM
jgi:hypothetical protein